MMSRKKKILILFHLCFVFTYLCWLLIQPYVKEILSHKAQVTLFEMVQEKKELLNDLLHEEQRLILEGYTHALQRKPPSFWQTFGKAFLSETPPFALAWLFFSLLICPLLLFQVEGAQAALWLLPLLVVGYGYFLLKTNPQEKPTLFPKELYVLNRYVTPQEQSDLNKREALLLGWHRYLIAEWALETISTEKPLFQKQLERGLFHFNVARLKWILSGKGDEVMKAGFNSTPSLFRIIGYFVWNLLFAIGVSRKEKLSSAPLSVQPLSTAH